MGILSTIIFLPILGILLLAFLPVSFKKGFRYIGLGITLTQLGLALGILVPRFIAAQELATTDFLSFFSLKERAPWLRIDLGDMGLLHIDYHVGIDGLGLVLLLLSCFILSISVLSAWNQEKRPRAFFMLLLLLDISLVGIFCALDFFLFYLFYELMLLPVFFLIGIWGGPNRIYAAIKFFLYTLLGSVFMLLVMIGLFLSFQDSAASIELGRVVHSFDLLNMMEFGSDGTPTHLISGSVFDRDQLLFGWDARSIGFLVLFFAFAIKIPVVPFHTWLPDAHVEAPTSISVILAGVLLKAGAYGMIRICYGIFPDVSASHSYLIALLGLISILYGALVAMAQTDLKRLVAYASVSHMGFVILGLASLQPLGLLGSSFQLVAHGIVSSGLFLLVGILYDRVHVREIVLFRGLWQQMPRYAFFSLVIFFAALGLPGLCSFVAELFVFLGAFQASGTPALFPRWWVFLASGGIVLGAVYFLRTYRQLFFGTFEAKGSDNWAQKLTDLQPREYIILVPICILILALGLYPTLITQWLDIEMAAWTDWVSKLTSAQ